MSQEQENQGVDDEVITIGEGGEAAVEPLELEEITIGTPEAPAGNEEEQGQDSSVIRQLRESQREEAKKRKEAERRLADLEERTKPAEQAAPEIGARPKLADFDYDEDAHEAAVERWYGQKRAREAFEAKQQATQEDMAKQQQQVVADYQAKVAALPVDKAKYQAAESEVVASLSPMQQAVLLKSPVAERVVMAIGNSPTHLEKLAKLNDPIALAMEIGRLETQLTTTKQKKSAPPPDRPMTGAGAGPADSALERLEAEAERTGDRSKVVAYKVQKRQATK